MPHLFNTPVDTPALPPGRLVHARQAPQNVERDIRDRVLDSMEETRRSLLTWLREEMRSLYLRRLESHGRDLAFVTADDARVLLDNAPNVPGPDRLNRNFLGQLFRGEGWEWTGQLYKSKTLNSHANDLRCWRWVERNERNQA